LVGLSPDVIVSNATPAVAALQRATDAVLKPTALDVADNLTKMAHTQQWLTQPMGRNS